MLSVSQPRIVIVGAGVAGISFLSALTSAPVSKVVQFDITLVEKKNFVESGIHALRYMVNPHEFLEENSHVLLEDLGKIYQRNGNTVRMITHAQATQLNTLARQLTIQKNSSDKDEVLAYDYLVLANGCSYKSPYIKPNNTSLAMTPDTRQDELQEFYQRIFSPDNDHVVIVGGGSLGIQLAGELVDLNHFRRQNNIAPFKITLVHSRQMLCDRSNSEIAHNYILTFLSKNGVQVLLGRRAAIQRTDTSSTCEVNPMIRKKIILKPSGVFSDEPDSAYQLEDASMVFWCVAMRPTTEWLIDSGLPTNTSGFVRVDDYFQSVNDSRIFAIGDVNDLPYEKLAGVGIREGIIVARNIAACTASASGQACERFPLKERERYEEFLLGRYALSLGSHDGIIGQMDTIQQSGIDAAEVMNNLGKTQVIELMKNPEYFDLSYKRLYLHVPQIINS